MGQLYRSNLYTIEVFGGHNFTTRRAFTDLVVLGPRNELFLASVLGEESDVKQIGFLLQEGKTGSFYSSESTNDQIYKNFITNGKKNHYNEHFAKIDGIMHGLFIDKSIDVNIKDRQQWEKEQEERIKAGLDPQAFPPHLAQLVLAWDGDIEDQIFKVLNDRYGTPMLDEWKDYIVQQLDAKDYYIPLHVYSFGTEYQLKAGLLLLSERELEEIITEGIQSYELDFAIKEDGREEGVLHKCETLDDYLTHFAGALGERIQENIRVRFDPKKDKHSPAFKHVNLHANKQGLTGLFPPQADTVMGVAKTLMEDDYCFISGEMGTGKTIMGTVSPFITEAMANNSDKPKPYRVLIYSPAIMVEKWKREVKERIPDCEVYEIKSWQDVLALRNKPYRPEKIEYYVMNADLPKFTYPMAPIKDWRHGEDLDLHLEHYHQQLEEAAKEGKPKPKAPRFRFGKSRIYNHARQEDDIVLEDPRTGFHCPDCGGLLTVRQKQASTEHFFEQRVGNKWVNHIKKDINYVCKNLVPTKYLPKERVKDPSKSYQECGYVLWQPERLPLDSKKRKVSPAWLINKKLRRGFFKYLIADEVHEYKSGSSEIGKALGQLINHTEKQLLLTGTLIGGMASDIFYLLARLAPKKLLRESITYHDESLFTQRYGVTEKKITFNHESGNRKQSTVKKPGISPHLFPMYLMSNCVFLELADLGYALPPYQEIPVFVDMEDDHQAQYNILEKEVGDCMRQNSFFGGMKYVSTYINAMYQYADAPFNMSEISVQDEDGVKHVIAQPYNFDPETFIPRKFNKLVEIIDEEVYERNRKVLVYVKYTGQNSNMPMDTYLYDHLKEMGYNVGILRSSGSYDGIKMPKTAKDREQWLKDMMEKHDWDVLITNPRLVKVGLDLLDFPTIVYYQMDYSVFDYMQSCRRSWRIKQTEPVKVYTLFYRNTIQENVLEHVAKKIDAAMAMQGKFSEEGLRAMADSNDGMAALAKSLLKQGKLDNVETIHERFQRLNQSYEELQAAKYNDYEFYEMNPIEGGIETVRKIAQGLIQEMNQAVANGTITQQALLDYMERFEEMMTIIEDAKSYNRGLKKKDKVVEGQLALVI